MDTQSQPVTKNSRNRRVIGDPNGLHYISAIARDTGVILDGEDTHRTVVVDLIVRNGDKVVEIHGAVVTCFAADMHTDEPMFDTDVHPELDESLRTTVEVFSVQHAQDVAGSML